MYTSSCTHSLALYSASFTRFLVCGRKDDHYSLIHNFGDWRTLYASHCWFKFIEICTF
uniref:Uncharacterized protein n=1 Tax=Arundo donax TaxID=35708 RepID=A0A0A9DX46_ARUDO